MLEIAAVVVCENGCDWVSCSRDCDCDHGCACENVTEVGVVIVCRCAAVSIDSNLPNKMGRIAGQIVIAIVNDAP